MPRPRAGPIKPVRKKAGKKAAKKPARKKKGRRTVLYSTAVRDAEGHFKDAQSCQRAHAADLRQKRKAEVAAAAAVITLEPLPEPVQAELPAL